MSEPAQNQRRKRRFLPLVWLSSAVAAALLVLGVSGTLSSWTTAIIQNDNNDVESGSPIILQETLLDTANSDAPTGTLCRSDSTATNEATCSTINKYGDNGTTKTNLVPSTHIVTKIELKNVGSTLTSDTFTVAFGTCSATDKGSLNPPATASLCNELRVSVACTGAASLTIAGVSPNALQAASPYSFGDQILAPGEATVCQIDVWLPTTADVRVANQAATQPITWTLADA